MLSLTEQQQYLKSSPFYWGEMSGNKIYITETTTKKKNQQQKSTHSSNAPIDLITLIKSQSQHFHLIKTFKVYFNFME